MESKQNRDDIEYIVPITNHSLATSGNYRNFYVDDDKNFYHLEINPLSGYPIQSNLGSISILTTTSCMEADGLSTALYMMDAKEVKDFLDKSNFDVSKIENFYYFKSNRWDMKTKKGLVIRLPSEINVNLLNTVNQIIEDENFKNIKTLDFRQTNQIITYE